MAEEEKEEAGAEAEKGGAPTMKVVIIAVLVSVLLSGGIVGGALVFLGMPGESETAENAEEGEEGEEEEEEVKGPPQYHSMDPKFVISFSDQRKARFMQFSLQLMTRNNEAMKMIDAHMPAVRSSLLMLFGIQQYEDMVTREGKEKLLQDVVNDVNNTITAVNDGEPIEPGVEKAYFNTFVIQ